MGSSPATPDTDGDGLLDRLEILAGLDPSTPSEAADGRVDALPAVQLTTFTLEAFRYRVETSADLRIWAPALPVITGTRGYTVFQLVAPDEGRYYRVRKLTP